MMSTQPELTVAEPVRDLLAGFDILWHKIEEIKRQQDKIQGLMEGMYPDSNPTFVQRNHDDIAKGMRLSSFTVNETHSLAQALTARDRLSKQLSLPIHDYEYIGVPTLDGSPNEHPGAVMDTLDSRRCPLDQIASQQSTIPSAKRTCTLETSSGPSSKQQGISRQSEDPASKVAMCNNSSPPPSATGSFAKCPIRLLDERPPEEIAEYFESHKHEIPRSHEICVKRYQSNAQSIRVLDAKYGNLVNMIQGLGMKHQPMLPSKSVEHEAAKAATTKSQTNISLGDLANDIANEPVEHKPTEIIASETEPREGRFDRALREIRVGESPTRPWGIRVPDGEQTPSANLPDDADAASDRVEHLTARDDGGTRCQSNEPRSKPDFRSAQMIFTGPVFIGYSPEREAELLRQFKSPEHRHG